ncbi:MAG: HEAT repeat domain-containing protein [Phycisphaerales bacterium]
MHITRVCLLTAALLTGLGPHAWAQSTNRSEPSTAVLVDRLLASDSDETWNDALGALQEIDRQKVLKELTQRLRSGNASPNIAKAMGTFGDPEQASTLIRLLRHTDQRVGLAAVEALGELGDPSAVRPLVALIVNNPGMDKAVDAFAAGAFDGPYREDWLDAVVAALVKIDDSRTVPLLIVAFNNPDRTMVVRREIAHALGEFNDEQAIDALVRAMRIDKDEYVRSTAATSLESLSKSHPRAWKALLAMQAGILRVPPSDTPTLHLTDGTTEWNTVVHDAFGCTHNSVRRNDRHPAASGRLEARHAASGSLQRLANADRVVIGIHSEVFPVEFAIAHSRAVREGFGRLAARHPDTAFLLLIASKPDSAGIAKFVHGSETTARRMIDDEDFRSLWQKALTMEKAWVANIATLPDDFDATGVIVAAFQDPNWPMGATRDFATDKQHGVPRFFIADSEGHILRVMDNPGPKGLLDVANALSETNDGPG